MIGSIKLDSKTLQKIQEKSSTLPKMHQRKKSRTSLQSQHAASPDKQRVAMDLPPHVVLGGGCVTEEDQKWVCTTEEFIVIFYFNEKILLINLFILCCLQS